MMNDDKKSDYYSMSEAWQDIGQGFDAKEKTVASLKLVGKGFFNVGKFFVKEGFPFLVEQGLEKSQSQLKRHDLSDEQRDSIENLQKNLHGFRVRIAENEAGRATEEEKKEIDSKVERVSREAKSAEENIERAKNRRERGF